MSQKQSASACTHIFGHIHSEVGKENKIAFRNYIIYLNVYNNPPPQKDEMR